MKIFYISCCGALMCLTACATPGKLEPKIETKVVKVEVVRPCVPDAVPPAPAGYSDDKLATVTDPVERTKLRAAANQERRARLAVVEPVVAACR